MNMLAIQKPVRQNMKLIQGEAGYDSALRTPYIASTWRTWDGRTLEISILSYGIYARINGGIANRFDGQKSFMEWLLENGFIELE